MQKNVLYAGKVILTLSEQVTKIFLVMFFACNNCKYYRQKLSFNNFEK